MTALMVVSLEISSRVVMALIGSLVVMTTTPFLGGLVLITLMVVPALMLQNSLVNQPITQ